MTATSFDDLYAEAEKDEGYWVAGSVLEFTEEIFKLMERKGISRSELARRLGTSPAYVTKILRGNANFTLATMVRLARALDADLRLGLAPRAEEERRQPSASRSQQATFSARGRRSGTSRPAALT